tara:strand:- start:11573 stop:12484 length:912 start_codon:yes stop_codon:yes gene_type:complete
MLSSKAVSYPGCALFALGLAWGAASCSKDKDAAPEKPAQTATKAEPTKAEPTKAEPTKATGPGAPAPTPAKVAPVATRPEGPIGTIEGKVTLTGEVPEMPLLRRGSDPVCDNGELRAETITAAKDGGLANVLVRIKPGTVPAWTPSTPVVIDQTDCMYRPRVTGGVRGQTVEVRNSDKTTHNVHARHLPLGKRQGIETIVNRAQPSGVAMSFELGDEPVAKLKCDYHGWMQGYVVVSDNPYFAVTGADGSFTLEGAPAGSQTIEFWHEYYGLKEAKAEVAADGSVTLDASFDVASDDPMGESK